MLDGVSCKALKLSPRDQIRNYSSHPCWSSKSVYLSTAIYLTFQEPRKNDRKQPCSPKNTTIKSPLFESRHTNKDDFKLPDANQYPLSLAYPNNGGVFEMSSSLVVLCFCLLQFLKLRSSAWLTLILYFMDWNVTQLKNNRSYEKAFDVLFHFFRDAWIFQWHAV